MLKIGFIGGGKMAQALCKGFLAAGKIIFIFILYTWLNLHNHKKNYIYSEYRFKHILTGKYIIDIKHYIV